MRLGLGSAGAGDPQQPRKVALDLQLELAQAFDGDEHDLVDQGSDGVAGVLAVDLVHGGAQLFGHAAVGFGDAGVERQDGRLGGFPLPEGALGRDDQGVPVQ